MGTVLRTDLAKTNKYWISKHRRLELTHFCLQYPEWEKAVNNAIFYPDMRTDTVKSSNKNMKDMTSTIAIKIESFTKNMDLIKKTCHEADNEIYEWLFLGVTLGYSFNTLKTVYRIPCDKNMYYDRLKRFYFLLDMKRS